MPAFIPALDRRPMKQLFAKPKAFDKMRFMKRKIIFLVLVASWLGFGAAGLKASDLPADLPEGTPQKLPEPQAGTIRPEGEFFSRNRLNDLERRVARLEEEINFLEDKTRNLDRRIDDLRSRHS